MDTSLLEKLISINSIYPNELEHSEFLDKYLQELGFKTERQYVAENRFNIFAERGEGEGAICFFGHMDTVPVFGDWDSDPFTARKDGDLLYGLGSVDMKGGIFSILEACRLSKDFGKKIKVLFCVDEENISLGAWNAIENKKFFEDAKVIIAAETGNIHPYDPKEKWVHLGRRGRCSIIVEVKGLSAHGAFPEKGLNAILEASRLIDALEKLPRAEHEIIGKSSLFCSNFKAPEVSLSIPEKCTFQIDRSLVPPETPKSALQEIKDYVNKLKDEGVLKADFTIKLQDRDTPFAPPYVTDHDNESIKKILSVIEANTDKLSIDYGLSVADENVFAAGTNVPVISVGPEGDNEHTANEWVDIRSLERLIDYYLEFIKEV